MAYKQKGFTPFSRTNKRLEEAEARRDMYMDQYASLPEDNPYAEMRNVYEDVPIDQREADLRNQQHQQDQANILSETVESTGSSGPAELVQALSEESKRASQESSAEVGKQEARRNIEEAKFDAYIQDMKIQGEIWSRNVNRDKQATLLGMSQEEVSAWREQQAKADEAKWGAIQEGAETIGEILT